MTEEKKVAIWGYYNYGNFGDDLMAVMIGHQLRANGYAPIVYRLDPIIASEAGVLSTYSLRELLNGAHYCIIGGGMFLASEEPNNPASSSILADLVILKNLLEELNIPVIGISIGGSAKGQNDKISEQMKDLISSSQFKGTTVRLPSDLQLLSFTKKPVRLHHDIVFTSSKYYDQSSIKTVPDVEVLIHQSNALPNRIIFWIIAVIGNLLGRRTKFLQTYVDNASPQGAELGSESSNALKYESITNILSGLNKAEVLISSKLHVGVCAVAFGNCFVSLGGTPKTLGFLKTIRRAHFFYPRVTCKKFIMVGLLVLSRRYRKRMCARFRLGNLSDFTHDAQGHFDFMFDMLSKTKT